MGQKAVLVKMPPRAFASSRSQLLPKEPYDRCIEVAVKGCPIEALRIGAEARQVGGEVRSAGREKREVASRHDMKFGLARQSI